MENKRRNKEQGTRNKEQETRKMRNEHSILKKTGAWEPWIFQHQRESELGFHVFFFNGAKKFVAANLAEGLSINVFYDYGCV